MCSEWLMACLAFWITRFFQSELRSVNQPPVILEQTLTCCLACCCLIHTHIVRANQPWCKAKAHSLSARAVQADCQPQPELSHCTCKNGPSAPADRLGYWRLLVKICLKAQSQLCLLATTLTKAEARCSVDCDHNRHCFCQNINYSKSTVMIVSSTSRHGVDRQRQAGSY